MIPFQLQRLGLVMEPEPGNPLEPEADYERRRDGSGGCEDPRITIEDRYTSLRLNTSRKLFCHSDFLENKYSLC